MATPIPFTIAPALRSGSFQSSTFTIPAGYSALTYSLTGMGSGPGSDYENPANGWQSYLGIKLLGAPDFIEYNDIGWHGGVAHDKHGGLDPAPGSVVPLNDPGYVGAQIYIRVVLTGTFTVGVSGVII